nr:cytochrome c3 family protein [Rhodoferax sp.]
MAWHKRSAAGLIVLGLVLVAAIAQAQIAATNKIPDVRGTKHNLSAAPDGSATPSGGTVPVRAVKATSETQVCVFCHTPHGATTGIVAPLWNRTLSTQTYTPYASSSMEADAAELAAAPGGGSKLCLSCHDGTMAIDKVNVLNGATGVTIPMTTASPVKMPSGSATTGFTRNLGVNLSADHPISFTYSSTIAGYDGELRSPDGALVGNRVAGATPPKMPLENGQMQCATCHDPHLRDKTTSNGNAKFLRMNRFQVTQPTGGAFSPAGDIICLACHDKAGVSWAYSAHANSQVATQTYTPTAAQQREFPSSLDSPVNVNPPVWQAGCLNCHDTHTVQGARRLLREGTDSIAIPKSGGNAALEETCYQCHTTSAASAVTYAPLTANAIPDIKTDFGLARRMPIKSSDQPALAEVHDIGGVFNDNVDANCSKTTGKCGKDMLESRAKLGVGTLTNRHAECSDCHNPHRVVKFRDFRGKPPGSITGTPDPAGTHPHTDDTLTNHTNIASGVLRGSWGVEPTYGSASFQSLPSGYSVKRGDPGTNASSLVTETYVTREYQICLKCHSDYGYTDNNTYPTGNRPDLGSFTGGTPTGTNNLTQYTNQAKEFQAPVAHKGEPLNLGTDAGAAAAYNTNNHRSWHPVMDNTGRIPSSRKVDATNWLVPWRNAVGTQTMYCSDCHGSSTGNTTAIPTGGDNGNPWGPHGSTNNFILKGTWSATTGASDRSPTAADIAANGLCFKCHDIYQYADRNASKSSGFGGFSSNMHATHADRIGRTRCSWCHVAVPHGWKNKAFLVNLNDVGPEAGLAAGTQVRNGTTAAYNQGPYYMNAILKVRNFKASGNWTAADCGSSGAPGNGETGRQWMRNSTENCANPP